ncbi:hypothetical protein [Bdellovibrio svalbardensis]|uniref:Uncharacterized protein n=1 Tax=Bdellovibrio svalbardensis TaxID=2972972 RepID=A0ABT6DIC7_9BACT|nr:hypothetical protein [Bdellovibrio svalbardensis]MDG0816257.1 hypothetical protein [Bdellovibrio svalbardensis]
MKKAALFSVIIVCLGLLIFVLRPQNSESLNATLPTLSSSPATSAPPHSLTPPSQGSEGTAASESSTVSAEFQQWFSKEAEDLEKSTAQPGNTELELRERVQNMRPEEIQYLTQQSLNMSGPAKQRILGTYLLTLAPNKTAEALLTVMEAPLQLAGDHTVHSTDETLSAQERSLRHMTIDALIEKVRQTPDFRGELTARIAQIKEPSLRAYAQKRLKELH